MNKTATVESFIKDYPPVIANEDYSYRHGWEQKFFIGAIELLKDLYLLERINDGK